MIILLSQAKAAVTNFTVKS